MLYITGIHALNIECSLETGGDWHSCSLSWNPIPMCDSDKMFFKDYGIELNRTVPCLSGTYAIANHIRACLDLLETGQYISVQGMNNDFICNGKYDKEIFDKVYSMRVLNNWKDIDKFMEKEYLLKWVFYKKERSKC